MTMYSTEDRQVCPTTKGYDVEPKHVYSETGDSKADGFTNRRPRKAVDVSIRSRKLLHVNETPSEEPSPPLCM